MSWELLRNLLGEMYGIMIEFRAVRSLLEELHGSVELRAVRIVLGETEHV